MRDKPDHHCTYLLSIVNDPAFAFPQRLDALLDLAAAITDGASMPCGGPGEEMHPTLTDEAMDCFEAGEEGKEVAQSLRVALAYGDDSGLRYLMGV